MVVTLQEPEAAVLILLRMNPAAGDAPGAPIKSYRAPDWDDMPLLAGAEAAAFHRLIDGAEVRFPR